MKILTKKFLFHFYFTVALLLFFVCANAQEKNISSGPFKFHGIVGPSGDVKKPVALMVADVPLEKINKECTFFSGDSLNGFDFKKTSEAAALDGAKMYGEFKGFMYLKQVDFIKKKYNIKKLPLEIANDNK